MQIVVDAVLSYAEASGESYFAVWSKIAKQEMESSSPYANVIDVVGNLALDPTKAKKVVEDVLAMFDGHASGTEPDPDLAEDLAAWRGISNDIYRHYGRNVAIDQFMQELQLRSKEPSPKPQTVTLMTVHGAKGREFDFVYVVGLAEDIMPSFQSRQKGDNSPEMEEERRNCFVAITRAKESLILSRASSYRGYPKQPSRFLVEMGLVQSCG